MIAKPFPPRRPLDVVMSEAAVTLAEFMERIEAGGKGYGSPLAQVIFAQLDLALKAWLILYGFGDPDSPEAP